MKDLPAHQLDPKVKTLAPQRCHMAHGGVPVLLRAVRHRRGGGVGRVDVRRVGGAGCPVRGGHGRMAGRAAAHPLHAVALRAFGRLPGHRARHRVAQALVIPFIRVQNTDTRQGPILRAFGLSSVTVATAAGEHEIPGLALDVAEQLRDRAAELARLAQEDV
ncbi:MAG: PH domain-containing protein [Eggerthellaceae bacterium]